MPKLFIETVGCQMNVLDSELVVGGLRRQGYELTTNPTDADVILFNTCSVREHAEEKIYSSLGTLRQHKKDHPEKVIGVLGCMAQKDQELVRVPELIAEVQKHGRPQFAFSLGRAGASRVEVSQSFESYDPNRDPEMR